jgi:hypothetical protein
VYRSGNDAVVRRICACLLFLSMVTACGTSTEGIFRRAAGSSTTTVKRPLLETRIEVPHVIVSGATVTGHLVIQNNTGTSMSLLSGAGWMRCTPRWQVSLGNDTVQPNGAFTMECGSAPLVLAPGENRLPFKLIAYYDHCGPELSGCPAPLPPGKYDAIFVDREGRTPATRTAIPPPAPVSVRVATAHP